MLKVSAINEDFLHDLVNDTNGIKPVKDEREEKELQRLDECRVNIDDVIAPLVYLMFIGEAPLFPLGDFSLIIGKAKSKKTRFLVWVVIQIMLKNAKCIWFDTEQSRGHAQAILRLITAGSGDNIEYYCLRPNSPEDRLKLIESRLNTIESGSIIVIDGVRDLVTDINDPKQATDCATWLMKITAEKNIHIINVLHQNKGDANARGHLGTELTNKATTVISVEKDSKNPEYSTVTPEYSRDIPFEPFMFKIGESGTIEIEEIAISSESRKTITPFSIDLDVHGELAKEIFLKKNSYGYKELITQIKLSFDKIGKPIGDNKAKDMLTHWMNQAIILHNGLGGKNSKYSYGKNI